MSAIRSIRCDPVRSGAIERRALCWEAYKGVSKESFGTAQKRSFPSTRPRFFHLFGSLDGFLSPLEATAARADPSMGPRRGRLR